MANRPPADEVLAAARALIESCDQDGRMATVAELAERVNVGRSAIYAIYPDAVEAVRAHKADRGAPNRGRPRDERAQAAELRARKARREADAARAEAATYAEVIRFLTEENLRLREEVNRSKGIVQIPRSTR